MRYTKDPEATVDFAVDWAGWLGGDTITASEFTVPDGLTKDTEANTTTRSVVWLSGGTEGETYEVSCRITTAGGRTDDRTIRITVRSR